MSKTGPGRFEITPEKRGSREYRKVSFPIRYGFLSEIATPEYVYQFNLNGELKFVQGRGRGWPHPAEWLKRTAGNDWVYYSSGEYGEIFDLFGEYYLPYFSYPSNSPFGSDPFDQAAVKAAILSWGDFGDALGSAGLCPAGPTRELVDRIRENRPEVLQRKAERLHGLLGGPVTVLPPDSRHVDYDVIPLVVADGCLYNCGFCSVKANRPFQPRTEADITAQVEGLRGLYGRDLANYNAVFLGHHDALQAGADLLLWAAATAHEGLEVGRSLLRDPRLFLFGSADSLLRAPSTLWKALDRLPFRTHLNVGLESADPATLKALGKPLTPGDVERAFERMLEINREYSNLEVSANFVFGGELAAGHLNSLVSLIRAKLNRFCDKGAVYLSPLMHDRPRHREGRKRLLGDFRGLKTQSRLPAYLYLIQRL